MLRSQVQLAETGQISQKKVTGISDEEKYEGLLEKCHQFLLKSVKKG
jgi:hypothetical protein